MAVCKSCKLVAGGVKAGVECPRCKEPMVDGKTLKGPPWTLNRDYIIISLILSPFAVMLLVALVLKQAKTPRRAGLRTLGWCQRTVSVPLRGSSVASTQHTVFVVHLLVCPGAQGAVGDRSIRTPTSWMPASALQHIHQAEEDRLVRIPRQQAIDQPAAATGRSGRAGRTKAFTKVLNSRRSTQRFSARCFSLIPSRAAPAASTPTTPSRFQARAVITMYAFQLLSKLSTGARKGPDAAAQLRLCSPGRSDQAFSGNRRRSRSRLH